MSEKVMDRQGRWRNKTVAFRVSPEEDEVLETAVKLSGLTKQDYIIRRLQKRDIVVQGNPKVYKALKDEMKKILTELQRIQDASEINADLMEVIDLVAETMRGIQKGLEQKLDKMVKRQLYTTYKTASTEEKCEKARQEYLDKCGISGSFRW